VKKGKLIRALEKKNWRLKKEVWRLAIVEEELRKALDFATRPPFRTYSQCHFDAGGTDQGILIGNPKPTNADDYRQGE